ncbi:TPA: hypothetical protein SL648_006277, partial [Pseudomonas aeruginosa]|nr:hypothetical protein [Pseudomonas aeruginosa]
TGRRLFILGNSFSKPIPLNPFPFLYIPQFSRFTLLVYLTLSHHAYFLGANDPYKALKTTLKAEIDPDAWATLNSDTSRPFPKPSTGRFAVKVINHLGDEVMKVFKVS